MGSRENILGAIASNKADYKPLPDIGRLPEQAENIVNQFKENAIFNGAIVLEITSRKDITDVITSKFAAPVKIFDCTNDLNPLQKVFLQPHAFQDIDIAIVDGRLAVAENGSIWISEDQLPQRVVPFITQHLMLVVRYSDILPSLSSAYAELDNEYGYGVFIAGPSKTADIEQSLVIGAHGPRSLSVFILNEDQ